MVDQAMEVRKFVSRGGIRVYGMPVEIFPGHVNNIYPFSATTLQVSRNRYRPLCFLCSPPIWPTASLTGWRGPVSHISSVLMFKQT